MTVGDSGAGNQPIISMENDRGATIFTSYATRQVKAYPVFETEIDSFNMFNTLTLAGFSGGASLSSLAVGILINAAFAGDLPPEAIILSKLGVPFLFCLALAASIFGLWAMKRRSTIWNKIKAESESEMRPGSWGEQTHG